MKRRTKGALAVVVIAAVVAGTTGTYYATQLSEETPPEEWTVVFSVNETDIPWNDTQHFYNDTPVLPLRIRITYQTSCDVTSPGTICAPTINVALRWKSTGTWEWEHRGSSVQEIVEISPEQFEGFGPELFLYVTWNPWPDAERLGYDVSFNLTVEVPS